MLQLILTTLALAFAAGKPAQCPKDKLKLRDCHLQVSKHKIHVWNDKILIQDEFARGMVDLPLKEAEWVAVTAKELAGRSFIEFVAWDQPVGQGEVASKKWYVYEVKGATAVLALDKLIQRRKRVEENRFKYDKAEKYSLSAEAKKVKWSVAREKGFLE